MQRSRRLFEYESKSQNLYSNRTSYWNSHLQRFATLILTVFAERNDRVGPILLFKGQGQVNRVEKTQYAKGVTVFFTPKGVINSQTMNRYVDHWYSKVRSSFLWMKDSRFILNLEKVKDGHPKLLIIDSANSHLNPNSARNLRQKSVVLAVIPKGCTMYLQALDVDIFSTFKHHYSEGADEFLEKNGPRNKGQTHRIPI